LLSFSIFRNDNVFDLKETWLDLELLCHYFPALKHVHFLHKY